jgi:hypothetical protein
MHMNIPMNLLTGRNLALMSLAAVLTSGLSAQRTYDQDKMAANYAEMQTHSWFTGGGWITDFDEAKAQSQKTGKPIFAYFTRTYAP